MLWTLAVRIFYLVEVLRLAKTEAEAKAAKEEADKTDVKKLKQKLVNKFKKVKDTENNKVLISAKEGMRRAVRQKKGMRNVRLQGLPENVRGLKHLCLVLQYGYMHNKMLTPAVSCISVSKIVKCLQVINFS